MKSDTNLFLIEINIILLCYFFICIRINKK